MFRSLVALIFITASACSTTSNDLPNGANGVVKRVVDGDTIVVSIDARDVTIRLIGINTPETKKPNSPIECFGPEASARTEALLPVGVPVRIERDIESRDKYGRLLAYVYREPDDVFINGVLIDEGFARPYPFPPNTTFATEFAAGAELAKSNGTGLWSACPSTTEP